MSLGERAVVHLRYDYAYGILCIGPAIPPKSTLIFRIQLLQINQKGALRGVYRAFTNWKNRMRARVGLQLDPSADFMTQNWRKDARMSFSVPSMHSKDLDQWADDVSVEEDDSKLDDFLLGDSGDNLHAEHENEEATQGELDQAAQANVQKRGSQLDMYKLRGQEQTEQAQQEANQKPDASSPIRPDQLGFKTAAGIGAGAKRFFR
jgi:FKBP-type peptidyl-prolyl cis-trans isomerase